jgi:two-component system NarL family sensor kinase
MTRMVIRGRFMASNAVPKRAAQTTESNPDRNETKSTETRLRELSVRLIAVQDFERRRIARELHDCTGQTVAVLKMNLERLARLGQLSPEQAGLVSESVALAEEVRTQLRTISYLLHPPLLDELGLASGLRVLIEGFSERSGIEARLEIDDNFSRLPSEVEISIYRIVQECLTNIHRHSGSPTARIRVERHAAGIEVEVEDNGKGMTDEKNISRRGVGLSGMRERARQMGGTLEIKSNGKGTIVIARLPFSNESAAGGRRPAP